MGLGLLSGKCLGSVRTSVVVGTRVALGMKSLSHIMKMDYVAGSCLIIITKKKKKKHGLRGLLEGFS